MNHNRIYRQIDRAKIISFDIFDTLLIRPYTKPSDVFTHLERLYERKGFSQSRRIAERVFYEKNGRSKEADINDIYSVMPDFSDMLQHELDLELQTISFNHDLREVYGYAVNSKKTIILCSDMYLPINFLENLIEQKGISEYQRLYVSNDINKRKDRGDLYEYVISDLKVKPSEIFHIGDNQHSDYSKAKEHGINALLYEPPYKRILYKNKKFFKVYNRIGDSLGLSIISSIISSKKVPEDYWTEFGYKYGGPLAYAYSRFIYDKAVKLGLDKILFIARDGYILEKVFNMLNTNITTKYVYAPRILNYVTYLDYVARRVEQPKIICEYFKQDYGNQSPHDFIEKNMGSFYALAKEEQKQSGFENYIKEIISDSKNLGVVDDVSSQLSGQRLIERASGLKTTGFYFCTFKVSDEYECEYYEFCNKGFFDRFKPDNKFHMTELIFSAPEKPIISMRSGNPVYQETINKYEDNRIETVKKIHEGVLMFVNDVKKLFGLKNIFLCDEDMMVLFDVYANNPTSRDIAAMFDVRYSLYADNSLYKPMYSDPVPFYKIRQTENLKWKTNMQQLGLILLKPLKVRMAGIKRIEITLLPKLRYKILYLSIFGRYKFRVGAE